MVPINSTTFTLQTVATGVLIDVDADVRLTPSNQLSQLYFTNIEHYIERSTDGTNFSVIHYHAAQGVGTLTYEETFQYTDTSTVNATTYYHPDRDWET
jgi:hypothetical protein